MGGWGGGAWSIWLSLIILSSYTLVVIHTDMYLNPHSIADVKKKVTGIHLTQIEDLMLSLNLTHRAQKSILWKINPQWTLISADLCFEDTFSFSKTLTLSELLVNRDAGWTACLSTEIHRKKIKCTFSSTTDALNFNTIPTILATRWKRRKSSLKMG